MTGTDVIETQHIEHDGQHLVLRVHPNATASRVAVLLPAMGVPARYYDLFAAQLVGAGFRVVVADLRGTGESTPPPARAGRYGYAELAGDVDSVLRHVAERDPGPAPLLIGHSLGCHVAALHLAHHDARAAGLVMIATGVPYHRCYPGVRGAGVRVSALLIRGIGAVLGYWPGDRLGFGGRQARGVMRDWAHLVRTGALPDLGGANTEAALAAVKTPVLAVSVAGDIHTPPATMDHLCDKFSAAPMTRHHYTADETGTAMDHFRWSRVAGPLTDRIRAFAATL
ncbi:MAG: alpha/beta fold hydrolase [Actinocatenispora sp.]